MKTADKAMRADDKRAIAAEKRTAVKGKRRCRMHGGAHGSGAPKGGRNGNYRHGFYTAKAIAERRALRALINKLAD